MKREPARVSHHRARKLLELLAERLDDDLLGVVDVVHDEPERAVVGLEDDDAHLPAGPPGRLLAGAPARPVRELG